MAYEAQTYYPRATVVGEGANNREINTAIGTENDTAVCDFGTNTTQRYILVKPNATSTTTATPSAGQNFGWNILKTNMNNTTGTPNQRRIPSGTWTFHCVLNTATADATGTWSVKCYVHKRSSTGTLTELFNAESATAALGATPQNFTWTKTSVAEVLLNTDETIHIEFWVQGRGVATGRTVAFRTGPTGGGLAQNVDFLVPSPGIRTNFLRSITASAHGSFIKLQRKVGKFIKCLGAAVAVLLDGVDDLVAIGTNNIISTSGTSLYLWFLPNAIIDTGILWQMAASGGDLILAVGKVGNTGLGGSAIYFGFRGSTGFSCTTSGMFLDSLVNGKHLICLKFAGGDKTNPANWTLKVDNVAQSFSALNTVGVAGSANRLGVDSDNSKAFGGQLRGFQVYNRVTTSTEDTTVFNAGFVNGVAALSSPALAIMFTEGTGTTAADTSGGGNNGTLTNGATWVIGSGGMTGLATVTRRLTAFRSVSCKVGGGTPYMTGLVAWWKADSLSLNDSDPVSSWTDSSGSGNTATGSGTARPLYKASILSGKPVLRFDGSNDRLAFPLLNLSTFTIFVVQKSTGDGQMLGRDTGNEQVRIGNSGSDVLSIFDGNFPEAISSTINRADFITAVFVRPSSNTVAFYENSVAKGTAATGGVTLDLNEIGHAAGSGHFLNGDIAEILIYSSDLSSTNQSTTQAYLNEKYFGGPSTGGNPAVCVPRITKKLYKTVSATMVGVSRLSLTFSAALISRLISAARKIINIFDD